MVKELHTGSHARKRPRSSEVAEMGEDRALEQDIDPENEFLKKMGDAAAQLREAATYLEKAKRMMLEKMKENEKLRRRNAELERKEAQRFSGVPPIGSDGEVASVGSMVDTEEPLPNRAARGGQLQAQGADLPSGRFGARPAKVAARRRLANTGGGGGEGADDTGGSEWDGTDEDDQEAWEGPEGPTGGEVRGKGPRPRKRPGEGARRRQRRPSAPGGGLGGKEARRENSTDDRSFHQALPDDKRTTQLASKRRATAQGDPANVEAPTAGGGSESGASFEGAAGSNLDGVGDESLAIDMLGPISPEKLPAFIKCGKRHCDKKSTFGLPDGSKPEYCAKHMKPGMEKLVNEDEQAEADAQNSSIVIKQEQASEEEIGTLEPREEEKSNGRVSNKSRNGQGNSSGGKQSPENLSPFTVRQESNARRRAGNKDKDGPTDGKADPIEHGEKLIGKRIRICLLDNQTDAEEGLITSFNKKSQKHTLMLYDGDSQDKMVALNGHEFELLDETFDKAPEEIDSFVEMDRSILQSLYGPKSRTVVDLTTFVDLTEEEDAKLNGGDGGAEEQERAVCGVCLKAVGPGRGARRRRHGGSGSLAAAGGGGARGGEFASCALCQATVHARCYHGPGLLALGATLGQGWNCQRCSLGISVEDASCYFCQQSGELVMRHIEVPVTANSRKGKLTNKSTMHWAHLLCARWDPDVRMARSGEVLLNNEGRIEFKQKPREEETTCDICADSGAGLCIRCCYPRCQRDVHAWCAKKHGHLQSGMSFGGRCLKIALCVVHKNMRPFPEQIIDYVEKVMRFPLVGIKAPEEMAMTQIENYLQDKLKEARGLARVKEGAPSDTHRFENFQAALSKLLACIENMPTAATNDYKRNTDERVKCLLKMLNEDSLEDCCAALETIGDDAQQGQEVFAEGKNGFFSLAPDMV